MRPDELTPLHKVGRVWLKRDDMFTAAGAKGGKARTCWVLAQGAKGLVTAGSRFSPQINIVARIAHKLGIPCRAHTPTGELLFPVAEARDKFGAEIIQHKAGYNSVIIERARGDAMKRKWKEIPFGMECKEAIEQTSRQVENALIGKRIVVPVGSAMSLAGILRGMQQARSIIPVLGIIVGADPRKRLHKWCTMFELSRLTLVTSKLDYHQAASNSVIGNIQLDPIYEAKCLPYVQDDDVFWLVGVRPGV